MLNMINGSSKNIYPYLNHAMKKIIKTQREYDTALEELEKLMLSSPEEGSAEGDELELLAFLIEAYEDEHVNIPPPTAIEAIEFRMDQMNYKQKDLVQFMGNKARVSEVLSGKRKLTVEMIRKLSQGLNIAAETLLGNEEAIKNSGISLNTGQGRSVTSP